ncbi:MAG: hypothetical protein H7Y38_18595, partial [Armatimonadetes bacterium]|nr:hypothetical protein [Armatimonadota bacterium]
MRVIKIADIPAGRNTGMGRQMWESADATVRLGHSVDIFCGTEVMPDSAWKKPRHLHFGRALVEFVEAKRRGGITYDVAEIHEACALDYAKARRHDRSLPPLVIKSHGLEEVMWELHLETSRKAERSIPLKNRIATPLLRLSPIRRALAQSEQIIVSNSDDAVFLRERLKVGKER